MAYINKYVLRRYCSLYWFKIINDIKTKTINFQENLFIYYIFFHKNNFIADENTADLGDNNDEAEIETEYDMNDCKLNFLMVLRFQIYSRTFTHTS